MNKNLEYENFDQVIKQFNDICEHKLSIIAHADGNHVGIKFRDKNLPISINESEYNFMKMTIEKHNLKFGFELSTGVGISTFGLAKGFKNTDGHLISLDSYFEELNSCVISADFSIQKYSEEDKNLIKLNSKAYNNVKKVLEYYNLKDFVDLEIGWSPIDSIKLIQKKNKKLDFIFLDCPKSDKEFERDITSLRPLINDRYVIFIHDTHTFTEESNSLVKRLFNNEILKIHEYYLNTPFYSQRHYPLGVITNLEL